MKDRISSVGQQLHGSAQPFTPKRVAMAAAFSLLCLAPAASWAVGLGRLSVQSSLGEPLRAEIDVSAITADEAASLQARVAPPDTYRAAGVDYNPVLGAVSISLQRRADGRSYLRLSSDRAVTEPFVDAILDLSWATGRLVREYTLLFDPPAAKGGQANTLTPPALDVPAALPRPRPAAPVVAEAAPAPAPSADAAPRSESRPVAPAAPSVASRPEAKPPVPAVVPVAPTAAARPAPAAPGAADGGIRVRSGDNLSRIAERSLPRGVSLDQMIVGLYRANPDAFQKQNMNRLRSGVVLQVPGTDQAQSVSRAEARQIIQAQSVDFAAFRERVAAGVSDAPAAASKRQASGKVQAEVLDRRQPAVPAPDKLTLSKGGMGSGPGAEDRLAQARSAQDDKARAQELSRNLEELRRLKDQAASKPDVAKPVAALPASVPMPASAPVVVASAPAMAAASAPAEAASDAVAASAAATGVADPASSPASAASRPGVELPVSAPPAESPDFLGALSLPLVAGAGAVLAALAGLGLFLRSRRKADNGETSFLESRLQPDSFFGASGGQRVDTRDATGGPSSMSYSLSQLDAIGDVDPVAEADVYLAYGRDLQAEEILKEALRVNPDRLAIRTKLAEVYAKRRDTQGFEQLAIQVQDATGAQGEDWARIQDMGLSIDPGNPRYQAGGHPLADAPEPPARFDALAQATEPAVETAPAPDHGLDLDISDMAAAIEPQPEAEGPELFGALADAPGSAPAAAPEVADLSLDFELPSLDEASEPPAAQAPATDKPLAFDLEGLSLDLGEPAPQAPAAAAMPAGLGGDAGAADLPELIAPEDPLARKLELAEEFCHIGDVDGARELLEEVVATADEATRAKAQAMLDSLH